MTDRERAIRKEAKNKNTADDHLFVSPSWQMIDDLLAIIDVERAAREKADDRYCAAEAQIKNVGCVPYFDRMDELAAKRDALAARVKELEAGVRVYLYEESLAQYDSSYWNAIEELRALLAGGGEEMREHGNKK